MVGGGSNPSPPRGIPVRWKRLYLDSGDLFAIADGRVSRDVVQALTAACDDHAVWLVVSIDHFQDSPLPDPETVDRLATALERFRFRALVTSGPGEIEPWPEPDVPRDIVIEGAANIREVMTDHRAGLQLAVPRLAQDAVYQGHLSATESLRTQDGVHVPARHREIDLQSTITQLRGWMGDDVAAIVDFHADRDGGRMTDAERATVVRAQEPIAAMLREVGPLMDSLGLDRTALMTHAAYSMARDGYRWAPGTWLGGRLFAGLVRNVRRGPLRSDSVDCQHAMHFRTWTSRRAIDSRSRS